MQFGALSVTLAAGLDTNVPVTATIPAWALGGPHEIQAWVWAQSRPEVGALAVAELVVGATTSLTASLSPSVTVVADATPVDFAFVLTNTGDLGLEVSLSITSTAEVSPVDARPCSAVTHWRARAGERVRVEGGCVSHHRYGDEQRGIGQRHGDADSSGEGVHPAGAEIGKVIVANLRNL